MSKKRLFIITMAILIIIGCVAIWFILYGGQGSSNTGDDTANSAPKATSSGKNLGDFIAAETSLQKFSKLLEASGENNTLKSTSASYIVIAPNNNAFKVLPSGYYDSLLNSDKQTNAQDIAKYHIITSTSAELAAGQKLKTNEGQEVIVGKDGNYWTFTSAKGDTATAIKAPIKTANGSLIIVDNILLPQ